MGTTSGLVHIIACISETNEKVELLRLVLLQNRYSVRWNTIELATNIGVFNELFGESNFQHRDAFLCLLQNR